ncbi:MAG: S8 family serine peptidase, partial [bacterium]|nr:S8 family serine peptidase [bacterium]
GNNQYSTDRTGSEGYSTGNYYAYFGGTSGACPVAAGVCALILSVNPALTPDDVQDILEETADDMVGDGGEDVAGWDQYMGWGRVNAYQAVLSAGNITVTSPNGGEAWYMSTSHNITWTSSGFTGNVKIELNRTYSGGTWETLYASTTNDGTQAWTVSGAVTTQARIRISSVNVPAITDVSDANFTIATPFITVDYPNGGETWFIADNPIITWFSGGFTGNVNIDLSRNGGSSYETLYSNTPNDGTQAWTVSGTVTSQARIRIRSVSNSAIRDSSDANFTITTVSVTMIAPNGGEIWNIGGYYNIQWTTAGITGNVKIELNRAYPSGTWEVLFASLGDDGSEFWNCVGPSAGQARVRVTSLAQPSLTDVSDADFSIVGEPPLLFHDPLDDFAPGTGTVTAIAYTPVFASVSTVKMYYREVGAGTFDSLTLASTANPNEFAASLAAIPIGSYEYYVKAVDNVSFSITVPSDAPATLYTVDVDDLSATELAYDDGSAEYSSWSEGYDGVNFQWAVKFGPVLPPYVLCGARFAASRSLPDDAHSPVHVYVYEADLSGAPGTLVQDVVNGSVGNDVGGVPEGTNWAEVILKDDLGDPLLITTTEFFIAVGNDDVSLYEALGRDDDGTLANRSYFYDPCEETWFSEDDTGLSDNAYPGNRLIRARGYSLVTPPEVVIQRVGNDLVLTWSDVGAPSYNVYSSTAVGGTFTFLQNTTGTSLVVGQVGTAADSRFYHVRASSE